MKVLIITRSTLYSQRGGDTVQVLETARHLRASGVTVDIRLADEKIVYSQYDLLHFFNMIRPADILFHIHRSGKPYVVSTIFVDYSEYDRYHRAGWTAVPFRLLSGNGIEYLKTIMRWMLGRDKLVSTSYIWRGQRRSVRSILKGASLLLPNSMSEWQRICDRYGDNHDCRIVPNGIDPGVFYYDPSVIKDPELVICAARIEGIKNQLNLIRALNGTGFRLLIIGSPAAGQSDYYRRCRRTAADNIEFIEAMPQQQLLAYYQKAKVHVLPSWFETTGLSSLEAAAAGCNIVISNRGDAGEYFGSEAFYCNPASPVSIHAAIASAANAPLSDTLRKRVNEQYTWTQATAATLRAYRELTADETSQNSHHGYPRHTEQLWRV
jgi:glycosyltransferase involved in cell wall biosynthesis